MNAGFMVRCLLCLFTFCWLTAITAPIPVPHLLSIENLIVAALLGFAALDFIAVRRQVDVWIQVYAFFLATLLLVTLLPSVFVDSLLPFETFYNPNWRLLVKVLVVLPLYPVYFREHPQGLLWTFVTSLIFLVGTINYQYFILENVDPDNGRPFIDVWGRGINVITSMVAFMVPLAIFQIRNKWRGFGGAGVIALLIMASTIAVFVSQSRVAFATALLGIFATILILAPRKYLPWLIGISVAGLVGLGVAVGELMLGRLTDLNDLSAMNRWRSIAASFDILNSSPWLGVGMDQSGPWFDRLFGARLEFDQYSLVPHNFLAQAAAETGVIGLLAYLCYLVFCAYLIFRRFEDIPVQTSILGLAFVILCINMFFLPAAFIDWYHIGFASLIALSYAGTPGEVRLAT